MTDFVIHVEGSSLRIDKYVLIRESTVFKAMLESEMSESTSNEIIITDYSLSVVRSLLQCLTDKTYLWSELNVHSDKLFSIILKYDFIWLSTVAERYFIDNLDISNALSILLMSDLHNRPLLKSRTLDYIVKYGAEILKQVKISDEIGPELSNELFLILFSRARPKESMYTLNCGVSMFDTFVRVEDSGIPEANGEYRFDKIRGTDKSASFAKLGWWNETSGKYYVSRSTLLATNNYIWIVKFKPDTRTVHAVVLYAAYDSENHNTPHPDLTWVVWRENEHVVGPEPSVKCLVRG
jgi:hypothetical protein